MTKRLVSLATMNYDLPSSNMQIRYNYYVVYTVMSMPSCLIFFYDLQEPIPTYVQLQADNKTCKELGVEHPSSAYYK